MQHDALIVGGSYAGLAAALVLARARRNVLVVDAGLPRNRFASHAHGVLGHDGRPGSDILADARAQLAAYPSARFVQGQVESISGDNGRFVAHTAQGETIGARRILLASGVSDQLPALPGLAERWGRTVVHCPYCHGYEIGGGAIGVLATMPMSAQSALLIADWGDVTLFTHEQEVPDADLRARLERRGVRIEAVPVVSIEGASTDELVVRLRDGRNLPLRALFVAAQQRMASPLAASLGCAFEDTIVGPIIRSDAQKLTSVEGIYAAGDAARAPGNITLATADGVMAGVGLHHSLIAEDATPASNQRADRCPLETAVVTIFDARAEHTLSVAWMPRARR
jgi:thioredoxin reductase